MNELFFASAVEIGAAIASREVSSLEVVEAHIARIREVDPKLNAIFYLADGSARIAAEAADEELARGEPRGPFHGVPFTVKDWIEVADAPCFANDERYLNHHPGQDATVVARMKAAGGVFLGKSTVFPDSKIYGPTHNPYRLELSPGGSSSGEAALIAAGGSPIGLGSDSGGSIREPAHFCGIAGLKPTTGRIPTTGHLPRINTLVDPRTVIGSMARYVKDLAAILPILSGVDWPDASVVPMPLGDWKQVDPTGLRCAFYANLADEDKGECQEVVRRTAKFLEGAGIRITEIRPPRLDEALPITQDYWSRAGSEGLSDEWDCTDEGRLSGAEIERHLFHWDRFRRSMISFMEHYDFILTPVSNFPARPPGAPGGTSYCLPYSLVGYPSVVVRAGTLTNQLPIGVQIVSRPWCEHVALAVASLIEEDLHGYRPPHL